eukprot:scaffold679_cov374-Prasinococcus_capsulatus_cf.AAC.10
MQEVGRAASRATMRAEGSPSGSNARDTFAVASTLYSDSMLLPCRSAAMRFPDAVPMRGHRYMSTHDGSTGEREYIHHTYLGSFLLPRILHRTIIMMFYECIMMIGPTYIDPVHVGREHDVRDGIDSARLVARSSGGPRRPHGLGGKGRGDMPDPPTHRGARRTSS